MITEDEATRLHGANEIIEGLKTTYGVIIPKDYGWFPGMCGQQWFPGAWKNLMEIERVREGVIRVAMGLHGDGKIQSALGGQLKIVRTHEAGTFAPPGILPTLMNGDIAIGNGIGGDVNYATSLVPHEFGHVWDYRTGNRLSRGLMKELGTWVCGNALYGACHWDPFAKHFDPVTRSWVYPEVPPGSDTLCKTNDPACTKTAYANTYGGSPLFTGPGAEDWAMSFEALVSPQSLQNYWRQTVLVAGGVRERYVHTQINAIP